MMLPYILAGLFGLVLAALPFLGALYVVMFLLSLPLRRQERARFFIDLLESGLQTGRSPEHSIISFSESRDLSMGVRFHLLAAYLGTGLRLGQALEKVPTFLPPQINALLHNGEETGDIKKVLPACRRLLQGGTAQIQSGTNFLVLLAFVFTPLLPVLFLALQFFVLPKYLAIFRDVSSGALPPLSQLVLGESPWLVGMQLVISLSLWGGALLYMGGPRCSAWLKKKYSIALLDEIAFRVPWKRRRLQRDFSIMLALHLDADIPEPRAVHWAAQATANAVFIHRAEQVVCELAAGKKLADAMQAFDDAGEFRWRLQNASRGQHGFSAALAGWIEALDAKAFQQEQAGAQTATTALVLLNGLMVGLIVIGIFGALVSVLNEAVLW